MWKNFAERTGDSMAYVPCMLDTKAKLPFTVHNTYIFLTATMVARARPDFGNTFIACPLRLLGRGKLINDMWFLKYIILLLTAIANTSPGTKILSMQLELHKPVIFTTLSFSVFYIKFFCISCVHPVL
jgi:hypothetical protein